MRYTAADPFARRLSVSINGQIATRVVAVDTDGGIAYGYAEGGELLCVIHRGVIEIKPDDQGFSDPRLLREMEVFLTTWGKEGGTPIAQFEEYVKPWQHLIN